jgi:hypothetical protein
MSGYAFCVGAPHHYGMTIISTLASRQRKVRPGAALLNRVTSREALVERLVLQRFAQESCLLLIKCLQMLVMVLTREPDAI